MFTRIGPGHIPVIAQPAPNNKPPKTFPRWPGFRSNWIGAPVTVFPYRFSRYNPGAVTATAVPMIP